jgi:hypothetical protein
MDQIADAKEGERFVVRFADAAVVSDLAESGALLAAGSDWLTRANTSPSELRALRSREGYVGSKMLDVWDVLYSDEFAAMFLRFENDDYGVPGRYEREHVPDRPIRREDLASEIVAQIDPIDAELATSESIQLADYFDEDECISWGEIPLRGGDDEV